MSDAHARRPRAELFRYAGLTTTRDTVTGTYELDGRVFSESVTFEGVSTLEAPAARAVAELWYLVAGLSYYKAGAARAVSLDATPIGPKGRALVRAALVDGLAEFAFRHDLSLEDVAINGGRKASSEEADLDPGRLLVPFGGGIDSVVTTAVLSQDRDLTLFIVSPASGTFAPLEATAAQTGLPIVRATRSIDRQILAGGDDLWHGHVPVTAMVTLLGALAAVASGRGGVVMSNEHSASVPNLRGPGRDVNHQWSKSLAAELLIAHAVEERVGALPVVASALRDRSELWVAQVFSRLSSFHHVFRSCNRSFTHDPARRAPSWCGECDKCLFINLVLAPFLSRDELRSIFDHEPLSDPEREEQLRVLVGVGATFKPFECVGDPAESAAALVRVAEMAEWRDVPALRALADELRVDRTFEQLLEREGPSRVPTDWLR